VTQLRKLMLEEIQRRNFTESTRRAYLRIIEDFARHFHRPPDQLGPDHIRQYTAHLFRDKKLSDNSVNQTVGALRFFFVKMLKRPWGVEETPYPKKRMRLPVILSRDEVARLIESAPSPFHRTILMTLYATGVRRTELASWRELLRAQPKVVQLAPSKSSERDSVLPHGRARRTCG
jgi:integrase/recombinase XerD